MRNFRQDNHPSRHIGQRWGQMVIGGSMSLTLSLLVGCGVTPVVPQSLLHQDIPQTFRATALRTPPPPLLQTTLPALSHRTRIDRVKRAPATRAYRATTVSYNRTKQPAKQDLAITKSWHALAKRRLPPPLLGLSSANGNREEMTVVQRTALPSPLSETYGSFTTGPMPTAGGGHIRLGDQDLFDSWTSYRDPQYADLRGYSEPFLGHCWTCGAPYRGE